MGLLNPLLLLLAGAAAVPLLLHLLQRHQGPRLVFPALRYLRRAEKESARRIRLRQLLLMLLRMAAVLLLALAAARPFVPIGGIGHTPTAAVIVLDNSMSTAAVAGETRVLDELKARALEALEAAGPEDRFWLLRAGRPGEPALAGDAPTTARRVRETEPTAAAADLSAALTHARALLAAGAEGRAREIHLLTDLQASSFGAPVEAGEDAPPVILWHPGTAPPANRAVAVVEVGGGLAPLAGQRTSVSALIGGDGGEVDVRLFVEGRLVAAARTEAGAAAVLMLPPRPAGVVTGRVEIDADALTADDRRYFAARVLPPPRIALTGALPFVDEALDVLAEAGRVERTGAGGADVVIAAGGEGLNGTRTGAIVVLPPTAPAELAAVNRALAAAGVPWRFGPPTSGEARFAADPDDSLLRALEGTRLQQVYELLPEGTGATDSVLVRLSDGAPWAVRGERGIGGTYVVLGSPLTMEASTLPTTAAMLPLLDRITGAWALSVPPRSDMTPGQEVVLDAGATAVERPDSTRDDVTGAATWTLGLDPGVYRVLREDSVIAAYAVNAPADESELARLDRRSLEARLPGWRLHVTTGSDAWRTATYRQRLGREIWRPLLAALLILLLVETVIAAAGPMRRAAPAA
jgi:hypothetical protein